MELPSKAIALDHDAPKLEFSGLDSLRLEPTNLCSHSVMVMAQMDHTYRSQCTVHTRLVLLLDILVKTKELGHFSKVFNCSGIFERLPPGASHWDQAKFRSGDLHFY